MSKKKSLPNIPVKVGGRSYAEVFANNPLMLKMALLSALAPVLPPGISLEHSTEFAERVKRELLELYRTYGIIPRDGDV